MHGDLCGCQGRQWKATLPWDRTIDGRRIQGHQERTRTDGVPLFVEELTKAVLESAGQSDQVAAVLG